MAFGISACRCEVLDLSRLLGSNRLRELSLSGSGLGPRFPRAGEQRRWNGEAEHPGGPAFPNMGYSRAKRLLAYFAAREATSRA